MVLIVLKKVVVFKSGLILFIHDLIFSLFGEIWPRHVFDKLVGFSLKLAMTLNSATPVIDVYCSSWSNFCFYLKLKCIRMGDEL